MISRQLDEAVSERMKQERRQREQERTTQVSDVEALLRDVQIWIDSGRRDADAWTQIFIALRKAATLAQAVTRDALARGDSAFDAAGKDRTLCAVRAELELRGFVVTMEYPGYLSLPVGHQVWASFGTSNPPAWGYDLVDQHGEFMAGTGGVLAVSVQETRIDVIADAIVLAAGQLRAAWERGGVGSVDTWMGGSR